MLQPSITASSPVSIGSDVQGGPDVAEHCLEAGRPERESEHSGGDDRAREPDERPREEPPALPAHPALGLESSSGRHFQTRANASAYASTSARGCGAMGYVWEKRQSERSTMDWVTGNWSSA